MTAGRALAIQTANAGDRPPGHVEIETLRGAMAGSYSMQ